MSTTRRLKVSIGSIVGIFTIGGMVWALYSKPAKWDQTSAKVTVLETKVDDHEKRLNIMGQRIDDQFGYIKDELHALNKKIGR